MVENNKRIKILRNRSEVKHAGLPHKLMLYTNELNHDQNDLFKFYNTTKSKQDYIIIMNCTGVFKKQNLEISSFCATTGIKKSTGTFKNTFCLSELEFIEKHGEILQIHAINILKKRKEEEILTVARRNMRCLICNKPLYPYSDLQVSRHHVDYIENIYIKVCGECHLSLHRGELINHRFGVNNVIWMCPDCNKRLVGAPCSKCGSYLSPGSNGTLHEEQRITKRRSDAGSRRA